MARPIQLEVPVGDARAELQSRLERAPVEHAEALLNAYELLESLHDCGVLDLLRGALGSRDELLEIAVKSARSPESIRAIRNVVLLIKMLGAIDPEVLKHFTQAVPEAFQAAATPLAPIGLVKLVSKFGDRDFRRGMAALNAVLETLGRRLSTKR